MKDLKVFEPKVMFQPIILNSNLEQFKTIIETKYSLSLNDYWDLHTWSVKNIECFWKEVWDFVKIINSEPYSEIVEVGKSMEKIPKWFIGSSLNYAENLLRYRDDRIALYYAGEAVTEPIKLTYKALFEKTSIFAAILKDAGVEVGDRVVGYMPNQPEAVIAMLAAASLGAIWSSTSPDFGVTAVLERFHQIRPKVLFSVDKVMYNGKMHDNIEKLQAISEGLQTLELIIVVPFDNELLQLDLTIPKCCLLPEAVKKVKNHGTDIPRLTFTQVPFHHPLFILYSSGTTGAPKCMVHSAGGTLIKHLSEHVFHGNLSRDDVVMFYTTIGWMMWNWLVTALAVGASVVLYDGSPFSPHSTVIWDLVDKLGITVLGAGAKWFAICESKDIKPRITHKLTSLHTMLSTASPLSPHSFEYVYRDVKPNVLLGSITGGSDIISCFAGQNPMLPVHSGEIQCCLLGMAVECFDESGNSVVGRKGELVCTKPFPCMPTCFWNDTDNYKYKKSYFSRYPGVWNHGDFCMINPKTKGIHMLGRSDGTLNPNGIRFGSAEIYNVVEVLDGIQDSVCVSQCSKDGEERIVLFLKMAAGYTFGSELVSKIQQEIRKQLSPRHVPAIILETKDIPYTLNGKKVEVAVKKVIAGESVTNVQSLTNPDSLIMYANLPELQGF